VFSFPTSIRHRLSLIVICAVLLAIGIATAASAWREASRFAAAKQAELTGTANVFASAVADELAAGSRSGAYQKLRAIGRIPGLAFARVEDTLGRRFAEIGTAVVLEHDNRDTGGWFSSFSLLFERSVEVKADIRKNGQVIGQLILVANSSELRERLREGLVSAALAALVAALIGIVLAWRWQRRITVPIQNLTRAMEEVRTTQDFSKQVARESDDETGVMVDTFNDMLLQIRNRDDRLAEHRSQLEVKVEERTRDLRTAKEAAEAANVAKSEFLATMSHEIRTPMNGMLVMAELMSGAELAPRQQRYAEVIVKSGQSLLSIINDILDFSKIESGSMELESIALDPAEVIDDVLNLFWERASSKGVDLAGYVGADVPGEIEGDPVRLNQVLSNLVNNALKFTESGHVVVIARKSAVRGPDGDELAIEFSVQDTGIGIPKDKLSSIFSAFSQADQTTTRKYGGTGLGLAICKKLVGAMGGRIGVTSTPGKGSAFSFTVATRALAEPPHPMPAQGGNLRRAVVAVTGSITPKTITSYLRNSGIGFDLVAPGALTAQACAGADAVFVTPDLVGRVATSPAAGTIPRPCIVCVSELGDGASDDHLDAGRAHDLIMRPISRRSMGEVISRLSAGTPLGRDATRRGRNIAAELPSFAGARVLVADDSAINREVIIEALGRLQVDPDVVTDGQAALDAVKAGTYDMVLMDCSMPVMDGFAATRAIRAAEATGTHLPVVALTAHVAGGPVDMWRDAGMDDCVTKPFTLKAMAACFEQWIPDRLAAPALDTAEPAAAPAPVPADDDTPVIDQSVLDMILEMQGDDAGGLIERIFGLYRVHGPDALQTLDARMRDGDREEIASAAHALKSMSFNVGAKRVGDACGALEAAARSGGDGDLAGYLKTISAELESALERIGELSEAA